MSARDETYFVSSLLEAFSDPVIALGSDLRVRVINAAAGTLFGEGLAGRSLVSILRSPDIIEAADAAKNGGCPGPVTTAVGRDGGTLYEVSARPVMGSAEGESSLLLIFRDVSAIDNVRRMRSDFVANVSHELKSPLTALLGFIETLRGPAANDTEAAARFLEIMQDEAERMRRLIDDLLSLSRVEADEYVRPVGRVDLAVMLRGIVEILASRAQAKGATIRMDVQGTPMSLPGNEDQLTQVLRNLIENALEYGGGDVDVTLSRAEGFPGIGRPVVRIDVTDHGPGIDPIHLPRLTERFYRVDNHRSRQGGGTGLGLAIVKHIVSRHRGRLVILSAPGEGSTFSVILPSE